MKKPPILSIPILMGLLAWTSPQVKSQDIFGWWPLNEGTGDTANDISGNDLSALINNVDFGGLGDGDQLEREVERLLVLGREHAALGDALATCFSSC